MRVEEAEGQQQQEAATAGPAAPAEPTPVQDEEMAAGEEAAAKPRLASKVVVPSPGVFDPRRAPQHSPAPRSCLHSGVEAAAMQASMPPLLQRTLPLL